jgi:hypothetical protein
MEEKINKIVEKTFENIVKIEGSFEENKNALYNDIHDFVINILKEHGIAVYEKKYKFIFHYKDNFKSKTFEVKSAPNELAARVVYFFNINIIPFKVEKFEIN